MRAIVTVERENGVFDEVGMNNRAVFDGRESAIRTDAIAYARGRRHRIEFFGPRGLYGDGVKTVVVVGRSK